MKKIYLITLIIFSIITFIFLLNLYNNIPKLSKGFVTIKGVEAYNYEENIHYLDDPYGRDMGFLYDFSGTPLEKYLGQTKNKRRYVKENYKNELYATYLSAYKGFLIIFNKDFSFLREYKMPTPPIAVSEIYYYWAGDNIFIYYYSARGIKSFYILNPNSGEFTSLAIKGGLTSTSQANSARNINVLSDRDDEIFAVSYCLQEDFFTDTPTCIRTGFAVSNSKIIQEVAVIKDNHAYTDFGFHESFFFIKEKYYSGMAAYNKPTYYPEKTVLYILDLKNFEWTNK